MTYHDECFPDRSDFFAGLIWRDRAAEANPPPPATPAEARRILSRVWGSGQDLTRREALALQAASPGGETSLAQAREIAARDGQPLPF